MEQSNQHYRISFGPSLAAPFAAATVEFLPFVAQVPDTPELQRQLRKLLPPTLELRIEWPPTAPDAGELVALLANAIQDLRGPNQLPHMREVLADGRVRVAIGFRDGETALLALRGGYALAHAIVDCAAGRAVDQRALAALLSHCAAVMTQYQPDSIARALMAAAARRDIPVMALVSGSRTWIHGEGVNAYRFMEASTQRDSQIGLHLARNKYWSSGLLKSLGLPSAVHRPATSPQQAVAIARRLGYPVVVKPVRGSKGKGVSIGIDSDAAVEAAFARAQGVGREPVLVERFIAGEVYRLSVFGGQLLRASRLVPPHVTGDGSSTVSRLVQAENSSRNAADVAAGLLVHLAVDADMLQLLRDQGSGLDDIPAAGTRVLLRRNSNIATGGKLEDVTVILHPDNRSMAETIARALHLDAIGIDFIAEDPARSWREGTAAVIEINATPGIASVLAERIIAQKFTGDGRIPAVLVVGDTDTTATTVTGIFEKAGLCVGRTGPDGTWLGAEARFTTHEALPARIKALLLDPACAALVVSASVEELCEYGLPYARFGLGVITDPAALPQGLEALLHAQVGSLLQGKCSRAELAAAVARLLPVRGGV